jgi:hypothetical protein
MPVTVGPSPYGARLFFEMVEWLNQCMVISEGRILPARTVEYKCYRVL